MLSITNFHKSHLLLSAQIRLRLQDS